MGLVGIYAQLFCLMTMTLSRFIIPGILGWDMNADNATLIIFTAFLALSRFGLWGFDLSVSQIMQEQVPADVIGTVNGVQGSLQEMFQITMYIGTLVITDPADFYILVAAAIGNVALAALLFTGWVCTVSSTVQESLNFTELSSPQEEGDENNGLVDVQLDPIDEDENDDDSPHLNQAMLDAGDSAAGDSS